MARFDIYSNHGSNQKKVPFLLDVQSNVISGLTTRIVIPLRPLSLFSSVSLPADLFPLISIDGTDYFLDTPQLGAIPLIAVAAYVDFAEGTMLDSPEQGRFTRIVLRLHVTIPAGTDLALAQRQHHAAHEKCYVANSVNFPILCEPVIEFSA